MSEEHVYARWIARDLGVVGSVRPTIILPSGRKKRGRERPTLELLMYDTCVECNSTWMSDLEVFFQREMLAAMRNEVGMLSLDPTEQKLAAMWATKTALLLELAVRHERETDGYAPPDNFAWLYDKRGPPPGTQVWLSGLDSQNQHVAWHTSGVFRFKEEVAPTGYCTTFSAGFLLVQVLGRDVTSPQYASGPPPPLEPPSPFDEALVSIWPRQALVATWPPKMVVDWAARTEVAGWPARVVGPRAKRRGQPPPAPH